MCVCVCACVQAGPGSVFSVRRRVSVGASREKGGEREGRREREWHLFRVHEPRMSLLSLVPVPRYIDLIRDPTLPDQSLELPHH